MPGSGCAVARTPAGGSCARWVLQRRCALSPGQLAVCFVALATISAVVATGFWLQGVRIVMLFAGLEMLALGLAFVVHAVHAADGELLSLRGPELVIERREGLRVRHDRIGLEGLRVRQLVDGPIELCAGGRQWVVGRHADGARRRQVLADLCQMVVTRTGADALARN